MNPKDYDPPENLAYLTLVSALLRDFRLIASHRELIGKFGVRSLTDITNVPEIKNMAAAQPLPPHFRQRDYQFRDPDLGRGMMDAAFYKKELVNVRVQLFFDGWFGDQKLANTFSRS